MRDGCSVLCEEKQFNSYITSTGEAILTTAEPNYSLIFSLLHGHIVVIIVITINVITIYPVKRTENPEI